MGRYLIGRALQTRSEEETMRVTYLRPLTSVLAFLLLLFPAETALAQLCSSVVPLCIDAVAGISGMPGFTRDGWPATSALLNTPWGIAVDQFGRLYIADRDNHRIRMVDRRGIITTVAGTGESGFNGDAGVGRPFPATSAKLFSPFGVAFDVGGNLFIADFGNNRIRRVDRVTGDITTVAGTGTPGRGGVPGRRAKDAQLSFPTHIAFDQTSGSLYIADQGNSRILKITPPNPSNPVTGEEPITSVAGTTLPGSTPGTSIDRGFNGDNIPATSALLNGPHAIAFDHLGNLFIADTGNRRIRKVSRATGNITTVVGNGTSGLTGDGGEATMAQLEFPTGIAFGGNPFVPDLYIADRFSSRIRKVKAGLGEIEGRTGNGEIITTMAGIVAGYGFGGDGGLATSAMLAYPSGLAFDAAGNLYIADTDNYRIRMVSAPFGITPPTAVGSNPTTAPTGIITTVAGSGPFGGPYQGGFGSDGGPARDAPLNSPLDVAVDKRSSLHSIVYIADTGNHRIRKVDSDTGRITTVAGTGAQGRGGVGGPAQRADLFAPTGVAFDESSGTLYIADSANNRILKITAGMGPITGAETITRVAGNAFGNAGFSGDRGPAADARLDNPVRVAVDAGGNLYIADMNNHRIRRVDARTQTITTVVGGGTAVGWGMGSFDNDAPKPANQAQLNTPFGVTLDTNGNLFIADYLNHRIRKVAAGPGGSGPVTGMETITTVAGSGPTGLGVRGFAGEATDATSARLNFPRGVAIDRAGNIFIPDLNNHRIRKVCLGMTGTPIITTVVGTGTPGSTGDGGAARSAELITPSGVALDGNGNLFTVDSSDQRVRKVNGATNPFNPPPCP